MSRSSIPPGLRLGEQLRSLPSWRRRLSFLLGRHTPHWCRVVMNHETRRRIGELGPGTMEALEVSGTAWENAGFASYRSVAFPEFDLCKEPLADGSTYDLVIVEQVLEHVADPRSAVRHARAMLRPGGWLLVTTPFLIRLHPQPLDVHRWTETGMSLLLAEAGFEEDAIETGAWGNRRAVIANLERWVRYSPLRHSLVDEQRWPLVIWAFAQNRQPDSAP